ncbi:glycosyltransferase family 25 protein, partial [Acinetobacter baumannii]
MKKILILCVSLKGSNERQEKIKQQHQSLQSVIHDIQIDFEFFEAIYGKKLPNEY